MARPQVHQPKIIELLQQHPEGMTRRELAEAVGCSPQQVHKVTSKGKLDPTDPDYLPITVVGQGRNGAEILGWSDVVPRRSAIVTTAGPMHRESIPSIPGLGEKLTVVGMTIVDGQVEVTVESDRGERHTFASGATT